MAINGVTTTPLSIIDTKGGDVLHAMKTSDQGYSGFGEAYFSKIKFNKIKAWKYHLKANLNLVVPYGKVKFVFYSQQKNIFKVIEIGEKKYLRLAVPPKIWFGFQGVGKPESIILNITNVQHNPKEILIRKKNEIKFNW